VTIEQIIKDIKDAAADLVEWMKAHNKAVDDLMTRVAVLEAASRDQKNEAAALRTRVRQLEYLESQR
jgi:hypothetical protein